MPVRAPDMLEMPVGPTMDLAWMGRRNNKEARSKKWKSIEKGGGREKKKKKRKKKKGLKREE